MQAGDLRHRVQLYAKTVARNATGEEVVTWTQQATLWAKVEVIGGAETILQDQAAATLTHTVTIRYYGGLVPTMRVIWLIGDGTTRTLIVHSATEDTKCRMMVLACSELVQR